MATQIGSVNWFKTIWIVSFYSNSRHTINIKSCLLNPLSRAEAIMIRKTKKIWHLKTHENTSRTHIAKKGSDRAFGMLFFLVFLIICIWPTLSSNQPHVWALITAVIFLLLSMLKPTFLAPLNQKWFKLGILLNRITAPLAMALVFYFAITPTAILMKVFGQKPLGLRFDKTMTSYWIYRDQPGPEPKTMKNQF